MLLKVSTLQEVSVFSSTKHVQQCAKTCKTCKNVYLKYLFIKNVNLKYSFIKKRTTKYISKLFGLYSKTSIFKVCATLGRAAQGPTVTSFEQFYEVYHFCA